MLLLSQPQLNPNSTQPKLNSVNKIKGHLTLNVGIMSIEIFVYGLNHSVILNNHLIIIPTYTYDNPLTMELDALRAGCIYVPFLLPSFLAAFLIIIR